MGAGKIESGGGRKPRQEDVPELSTPAGNSDSVLLGPSEEPCGMHPRLVHFSDEREQGFPTHFHPPCA